jgi:formylglycine-generating enzyme required for sulfatase activity
MNQFVPVSCRLFSLGTLLPCAVLAADPSGSSVNIFLNTNQASSPFMLAWDAVPGRAYQVQTTTNLGQPWMTVPSSPRIATNSVETFDFAAPAEQSGFFRIVQLTPDPPAGFSIAPAGTFVQRQFQDRTVTITKSFYVSGIETTKGQWDLVCVWAATNGYSDLPVGGDGFLGDASGNHPVTDLSWHDAVKWCNARSEMEGLAPVYRAVGAVYRMGENDNVIPDWTAQGYRLPTEAEWEYASRAGTTTPFYTGLYPGGNSPTNSNLDLAGWYWGNSSASTHLVGQKEANAWGLCDTHGNVWEWCWDWSAGFSPVPITDPKGPASGSYRVYRGGSWSYSASYCTADYRRESWPDVRYVNLGFRTVLVPRQ